MAQRPDNQEKAQPELRPKRARRNVSTAFGAVLVDYMSRQRPIWTSGQLSDAIGEKRQTVANWLYHNITPPTDKMLSIMVRLGIPMEDLMSAYNDLGVETPELTAAEPDTRASGRGIPATRYEQERAEAQRIAERERERVEAEREWNEMIAHTRAVMAATGFPASALEALIANLEQQRTPFGERGMSHHIASEHAPTGSAAAGANESSEPGGEEENAATKRARRN